MSKVLNTASKNLKFGKFTATFANKMASCLVFIKINTSEKALLFSICRKYKQEKMQGFGLNPNNEIMNCFIGEQGIIIECLENKIISNITQFVTYLHKCQLKNRQYFGTTKSSYNKLNKDAAKFDVEVVGKCKTFIKNNLQKESTKFGILEKVIASIQSKTCKENDNKEFKMEKLQSIRVDSKILTEALILMKGKDFMIVNGDFKMFDCICTDGFYTDTFRGIIKSFIGSVGVVGKAPANGVDSKYKSKIKIINDANEALCRILCELHGCKVNVVNEVNSDHIKMLCDIFKFTK